MQGVAAFMSKFDSEYRNPRRNEFFVHFVRTYRIRAAGILQGIIFKHRLINGIFETIICHRHKKHFFADGVILFLRYQQR